jgi:hypothetical protein
VGSLWTPVTSYILRVAGHLSAIAAAIDTYAVHPSQRRHQECTVAGIGQVEDLCWQTSEALAQPAADSIKQVD